MSEFKEEFVPSQGARFIAGSINQLVHAMMNGDVISLGVCAKMKDGDTSMYYYDPDEDGLSLSGPIEELRASYHLNQTFRRQTTAPPRNRSYRSN